MSSRLIIALDFPNAISADRFVTLLSPQNCKLKVGLELFVAAGPDYVKCLVERGFDVFLDLKFHDIPNTVAAACRSAAELGVWMINVHAAGGEAMLSAAKQALQTLDQAPKLIAVTVLTSMSPQQLSGIGVIDETAEQVQRLAQLSKIQQLDGIVCSAQEAAMMRQHCGQNFLLITPGIRPIGSVKNDQQRIMTPADAIQAGSDYLVIGRPITQAVSPLAVIEQINTEIA